MKIINGKKYTVIKPSEDLVEEAAKNFILECEIEIAKHNTEIYVFDLSLVSKLGSTVLAFFVSTFCPLKNTYYSINTNSSILDIFKLAITPIAAKFIIVPFVIKISFFL